MSTVLGQNLAAEQKPEYRYVKGVGWQTWRVFHGPTKESVTGLIPQLEGYEQIEISSPDEISWRLRATIGGQGMGGEGEAGDVVDDWEVDGQSEIADILTHPSCKGIDVEQLRVLLQAVQNPKANVSPALTDPNAISAYLLKMNKQDSYFTGKFVLRHTQTVTGTRAINVSAANILKVYRYGDLPARPAHITTFLTSLQTRYIPVVSNADYTWGWLKLPPKIRTSLMSKTVVTEEWVLDAWSTFLYESVS